MTADLRFGRFRLLPVERQLLADGVPVKLGARAFDLLQVLVERCGETVPRRELLDRVWPGRVVEDQNLQVHIVALRKVLGADAIATIPGRGYRFTLPLDGIVRPGVAATGERPDAARPSSPMTGAGSTFAFAAPRLFGRAADVAAVCQLLVERQLVTIAGPAGIGKTRLAQAVAADARLCCADGVGFVELAALSDGDLLPATVAHALGFAAGEEQATAPGLARSLCSLSLLIVLDNCEHLLDSAARLAEAVLAAAPHVRLLVTSQEPLKLFDERVYRLDGLAVPVRGARDGFDDGAVALFVERVRAIDPGFALTDANVDIVIDICRRLDGVPLALELAASRLPVLGAAGLRDRLGQRLRLLGTGSRTAPDRQQTLRGALEWSHGLLGAGQKAVFRRLGVFAGSFSLAGAQAVATDAQRDEWAVLDELAALVDKSLVQLLPGREPRYRLLESARAFALERLAEAGETATSQARHAHAVLQLFDAADAEFLATPTLPWVDKLLPDLDNLREAMDWACGPRGDPALAIALAGCSGDFWLAAGLAAEGARRLERLAPTVDSTTPPRDAARFWLALATLSAGWAVPPARALEAASRALELFRSLGDREGSYRTLGYCVRLADRTSQPAAAVQALLDEMRALEAPHWNALQTRARRRVEANWLGGQGRWNERHRLLVEEIGLLSEAGDERGVWMASHMLALTEVMLGRPAAAAELLEPVVAQLRERGLLRRQWAHLAMLALARIELGDVPQAMAAVREVVTLLRAEGMLWWMADHLAWLAAQRAAPADAARLLGWADARLHAVGEERGELPLRTMRTVEALIVPRLGEAEAGQLRAEGAAWTDDRAVAAVLGAQASP